MNDYRVVHIERHDPRLGRTRAVFDERSRAFALGETIDTSAWVDKRIRIYDPLPNPNQCHGECTYCSQCMMFNAVGNRVKGVVLDMNDAHQGYSLATRLDPFAGAWPPDDTGSSLLAACKASQSLGHGGEYRWNFQGARGVGQQVQRGRVVVVGTRWDWNMFKPDADGRIHLGGGAAGGHSWIIRGRWQERGWNLGRCWWGSMRDFWISDEDLDALLADDGESVVQDRAQ